VASAEQSLRELMANSDLGRHSGIEGTRLPRISTPDTGGSGRISAYFRIAGVISDNFKHNWLMSGPSRDTGTLADLTSHSSAPEAGSSRSFGIVFAVVFTIIGCWPLLTSGPVRLWALVVAALFLSLALAAPKALAPLNRHWMKFGLLLGRIVSPIVLFLVYIVAVVPSGILMRLMGRDPMHRQFDPTVNSYWIPRVPVGKPDRTMANQF
jgi:Saxitoxin biosynthesis operon protein SxtJ